MQFVDLYSKQYELTKQFKGSHKPGACEGGIMVTSVIQGDI